MRKRAAIAALTLAACGTSNASLPGFASNESDDAGAGDDGTASGSSNANDGGETLGTGGDDDGSSSVIATADAGGASSDGCTDATRLVYVVDVQNTLHSFDPGSLTFRTIGTLHCPSTSTPASMAVSRSGVAWVTFLNGDLFNVSINDASCTATAFKPMQAGLGYTFGMAFATGATGATGSTDEKLFVIGSNGNSKGYGLGTIDTASLVATRIGDFTNGLAGRAGELTGTGDGRLYGFVETDPNASLAQIDQTSAATASPMALSGVNITGDAFAFSFWGGDFWLYTATSNKFSDVTQLKASSDNSLNVVLKDVGFTIVGAGVSTCAPTVPPPVR